MLRISFNDLLDYQQAPLPERERRLVGSYPVLLHSVLEDRLTKTQKCYIMLYYIDKKPMTEIARMFGVNRSTVSRTINRARERLAKAIGCVILKKAIEERGELQEDEDPDN